MPKYQVKADDLVSLRTCLAVMLDKCEDAIRANKPLPISEELYFRFKEAESSTKYSNLKLTYNDSL